MSHARLAAITAGVIVFSVAGTGCKAPNTGDASPRQIPGVTFLGDKAHPVKIFQLSADGRAAVEYVFDAAKEPPAGRRTDSAEMPDYAHSFFWTEAGGLRIIRTRDGRDVEVRAISADGATATGRFYDNASLAHVFRWTEAGGIEDLGAPDGPRPIVSIHGGMGAMARTVSTDGSVIFGTLGAINSSDSFRWTRATGVQKLHIAGDIKIATPDGSTAVGMVLVEPRPDRTPTPTCFAGRWPEDSKTSAHLRAPGGTAISLPMPFQPTDRSLSATMSRNRGRAATAGRSRVAFRNSPVWNRRPTMFRATARRSWAACSI